MIMKQFIVSISFLLTASTLTAQDTNGYWHGKERSVRYKPAGEDFVIVNGNRKFTRALYGTNSAFRVETSDVPEFALYLPGMGGNIKIGIINKQQSKWLSDAKNIVASYKPGSRSYVITDELLGKGKIEITVLALADAEGIIIKTNAVNIPSGIALLMAYGGVTGRKFSRDGDMGPDPESVFYMKPDYCKNNIITTSNNEFSLQYGSNKPQYIYGIASALSNNKIVSAVFQDSPANLLKSKADSTPVWAGTTVLNNNADHYLLIAKKDSVSINQTTLAAKFVAAEKARQSVAGRIKVTTPDPHINAIGAAIAVAADAIWESPSFMHGAIGWRMRLNGWRGAYAADVLGWHDRARQHFRSYALSQLTTPDSGKIIADTALNLARHIEKLGTAVFSSGYISRNPNGDFRPHHYDMNLVFIDQLLWHFNWTGDTAFVKEMWPLLQRHLAWEKRNFDMDDDGLYDAYAAIWASDALQYSGGAVTHSSAYNYRANKMAAELATLIGEDGIKYKKEAEKTLAAINEILWLKDKGVYAEFKDALGEKLLHKTPAVWSIYHSLDSDIADAFQAYQSIQYIHHTIPHIPLKAKGLENGLYTISTSNWMPYAWSINNVALGELMHTSLAMWQANNNEDAFTLWKSSLMESMYMGGSPGNFQQISSYDAARGEAYRDFADPVGMTARSLVQGLFGILPDALHDKLLIKPGFPSTWNKASIQTPDIKFSFKRTGSKDEYFIEQDFEKRLSLQLLLRANGTGIKSVIINGKKVGWKNNEDAIDIPMLEIAAGVSQKYHMVIEWTGNIKESRGNVQMITGGHFNYSAPGITIKKLFDPQELFTNHSITANNFSGKTTPNPGNKTAFLQIQQGNFLSWKAINATIQQPVSFTFVPDQFTQDFSLRVHNNTDKDITAELLVNNQPYAEVVLVPGKISSISIQEKSMLPGSNRISLKCKGFEQNIDTIITNWNILASNNAVQETVDLTKYFNDKVNNIFRNKYLSPRPAVPTLQLPVQGIGEWTHPKLTADIEDSGFRQSLVNNRFQLPQKIIFQSIADSNQKNIAFTSQWDNFPSEINIPLKGKASHAYFLMAGSTNPMQSQMVNGKIIIHYTDGSKDTLLLKNPENWWPIEQDYLNDGYAFNTKAARPVRVHLKTGKTFSTLDDPLNLFNGKMIEGGAATVLDLPLNKNKVLQSLVLQTNANDVIIGLMGITLLQ